MRGGGRAAPGIASRRAGWRAEFIAALRRKVGRAEIDLIALALARLPMHIPDAWKGG